MISLYSLFIYPSLAYPFCVDGAFADKSITEYIHVMLFAFILALCQILIMLGKA